MTPLDFVVYDGNSEPNTPVHRIAEAMRLPLKIVSAFGDWEVVSYYYDDGQMVLEIVEK